MKAAPDSRPARFAGARILGVVAIVCLLLAILLLGWGFSALGTSRPVPPPVEPALPAPIEVVEDLPRLAERMRADPDFMGAILVARGDKVLFRQVYGMAEIETGRPLKLDTPFRLASISKQFTAAAILKLEEDGRLKISDPVCLWIAPCPESWEAIRVHHLLWHGAGLPDLMARPGWGERRVTPATLDELTKDSMAFRPRFPPGSEVGYNNAAYNLAAAVVEAASGMAFDAYLRTALLAPLGLTNTGVGEADGMAMGYGQFPSGRVPQPNANVGIVLGAGAMYSTLDDMLAWQRALHGGRALTPETYQRMIADHAPADTPDERGRPRRAWGYGLFTNRLGQRVEPAFDDRQIYHTGSWAGFRNMATYQPEAEVTVIVLTNNYHQREKVFLISQQAMAEALGRTFPEGLEPPATLRR